MKNKHPLVQLDPKLTWQQYFVQQQESASNGLLKQFYQAGVIDPNTLLSEVEFVALDFETTGLDVEKDGIISIGLIPFTLNRIYCKHSKHWLVKPRKPLNEDSVVIHGITHNDLSDAPDLRRILEEVLDSLTGKIVVVHYQYIERQFFDRALKERIGEGILFPMVDTLAIESAIQAKAVSGWWDKLRGKKPESVRLGTSRSRYHLPAYQPHHALVDAIATAELLQAQILHHYSPDTPIKDIWC
ncbi:3'-5' exonuclease [Vibrio rumoiensis]|uniref:DNA-directed DNA polymerase n=1 Tax=Vibrio rumoiensis 1S-45 TaxID=1188252 RepID=A0A1E5E5L4_9VIBR|nr:3'-5' exonuclease [Vibrio rumoiensis]OEF29201.1 DNA polymerase III subunit epsilon [Vibrio rumoiensis 1S-45]